MVVKNWGSMHKTGSVQRCCFKVVNACWHSVDQSTSFGRFFLTRSDNGVKVLA